MKVRKAESDYEQPIMKDIKINNQKFFKHISWFTGD